MAIVLCRREDLPAVHAFSCCVFDHESTPNDHPSLDEWLSRFDTRKGVIFVKCRGGIGDSLAADEGLSPDDMQSYMFVHEGISVLTGKTTLHVWLCATDISHRGKGITRELFALAGHEAKHNRGCDILSVNTYPLYFPDMYRLLSRSDSGFECVLRKDQSFGKDVSTVEKACFEKQL